MIWWDGPLGGQDDDDPGRPAACYQVAGQGREVVALGFLPTVVE